MAENGTVEQPRSVQLQADLAEFDERTGWRKRLERVGFAGTVALEGAGYASLTITGNSNTGGWLLIGGVATAAGTLMSFVPRVFKRDDIKTAIKSAENDEKLVAALPVTAPKYGMSDAIANLQIAADRAESDYWDGAIRSGANHLALQDLLREYELWNFRGDDIKGGIAGMALVTLREYARERNNTSTGDSIATVMMNALDTYLPIDQTADTITPRDPVLQQKTWATYIGMLYEKPAQQYELASCIDVYPTALLPAAQIVN